MSSPFENERRPVDGGWPAPQSNTPQSNTPQGNAPQGNARHSADRLPPWGYGAPQDGAVPTAAWSPGGYHAAGSVSPGPHATAPESVAPPRRRRRTVAFTVAALAIAVAGGAAGAAATAWNDHATTSAASGTSALTGTPTKVTTVENPSTTSVAALVKKVDPVVVSLTVTGGQQEDLGSGIVLSSDGLILTNNHVVSAAEDGGTVSVTFTDGKTVDASIVAADTSEDLAIVKAQGVSGLATAQLADSNSVQVGDTVVAIGDELGLSNSVSEGIVSALHRKVSVASDENTPMRGAESSQSGGTTYGNAIQTDAAINQGDSGGALFNTAGQVIGIDSAIATGSDGSSGSVGIGFAIAINDARAFINANT